jgi:uncharacterized protein (TIGR03083 family)
MSNADATIAALRSGFDELATLVSGLGNDELANPTGASEWDVSQVLSHLGSGAEIAQNTLQVALVGTDAPGVRKPGMDFNRSVWDRYDGASRRERADWFLRANEALTQSYESLSEETRETLRVDLGFLPAPVDVATAGGFRLNELALHSWDVRVGFDAAATVAPEATVILVGRVGGLAGFLGKTAPLGGKTAAIAVTTTGPALNFQLHLAEPIAISPGAPEQPDGSLTLPAEAWVRLIYGRLKPPYIPASVQTSGAADLDLLRQVFPGF